jgi:B9 domain-containing protein 2
MAELHVVGQLVGATDFPLPSVFCKFAVEVGSNFRLLQGATSGQTQCDMPQEGEMALLAHPIDVHYAVKGIDGWPRLRIEVYGVDSYGRVELAGYGCCIVPTSAGTHQLRCATWRPCGSLREQFSSERHQRDRPTLACDAPDRMHVRRSWPQLSSLVAPRGSSPRS